MRLIALVERKKIFITGRVQGVGFRPCIYKIANRLELCGFVFNDTKGVTIELQGEEDNISEFTACLGSGALPAMAKIESCEISKIARIKGEDKFVIKTSQSEGTTLSQVTADIATCTDCLCEMKDEKDFRYRYPFINCTSCGPRYSIVKNIPYDRCNTTMSVFEMCEKCGGQYKNTAERRFHAQPIACSSCGPKIWLTDAKGRIIQTQSDKVIAETVKLLSAGKIAALKGVGGFHLAVNAIDEKAVVRLRRRKKRDHKPFALMANSIERIKKYAIVSKSAEKLLASAQSPIVLLPRKKDCAIAKSAAEGVVHLGFMLCYAPLHYLLFEQGLEVLVMTSGNISDEPLICKNDDAIERLGNTADVFLMNDREIYRRVDDSIVHFVGGQAVLLRRARGYVPAPVISEYECGQDVLAVGGDLKNTFCFVKKNQLICSEHVGDLENADVYHHYIESVEHLRKLFEVEPELIACDLHPGYISTQYALSIPNAEVIQIQHHWAHIGSVLAEHNFDGAVIGLAADGTGYGADGAIWGCECLIASLESFTRFGHLSYYSLAGGDKAGKEAIRSVLGLLSKSYGEDFRLKELDWLLRKIEPDKSKCEIILEQLEKQVNCVETSSMGRVFDAVAAMVGMGNYNHFEAQLPMLLEAIIEKTEECYEFEIESCGGEPLKLDLCKMIKQILADIQQNVDCGIISAKFHNTAAAGLVEIAKRAREKTRLNTVALSGGVFCNRYLANRVIESLKKSSFCVLFNKAVPSNDGGISLGQAAIAARKVRKKQEK